MNSWAVQQYSNRVTVATQSCSVLLSAVDGHTFHLQKVILSVASLTDGAYFHACMGSTSAATGSVLFTESCSVPALGFLDYGEKGYPLDGSDGLYYNLTGGAAKVNCTVIGYII